MLAECLEALFQTQDVAVEAVIVVNGSSETAADWGAEDRSDVQILRYERKIGFAAACNQGVEAARGDLIFLLNNDAVVAPTALRILQDSLEADDRLAATVPKLLYYFDPTRFDYASAAGGLIDRYGFPFARGRIFDHIESDGGQYDAPAEVFWGAGAALMVRKSLWMQSGGLEERFFAHMEEIDLLWRLQLMGYSVRAIPESIVRHRGAVTIRSGSFQKAFLNHRNSLWMLVRNYRPATLWRYFPGRIALDAAFGLYSLARFDFKSVWAVLRAWAALFLSVRFIVNGRRRVRELRRVDDSVILERMFPRSIAWQFFVKGRRRANELPSDD